MPNTPDTAKVACKICDSVSGPNAQPAIFENDLWHICHTGQPYPLAGWMMLISKRHVPGAGHFDDREAKNFGLALRHFSRVLEDVTGALRIYTAAMGESSPHFHCHLVPRYEVMPKDAKAWAVFDLQRAAAAGEIQADATKVAGIIAAFGDALRANPPPT